MRKGYIVFILSLFLIVSTSWAEEQKEAGKKETKLEEIVVTATKTERAVGEIPASVTVITREEIENSTAQNVDDLLENVAGIYVIRYSGIATTAPTSINSRGITGTNRVLVLVDGIPLNSGVTGFVNWNSIPLDSIERVEIVRGPFSSLYGTNAMGGVINIITRRGKEGFRSSVESSGGNEGYYKVGFTNEGGIGPLTYFLTVNKRRMDNYLARDYFIKRTYNQTTGKFEVKEIPLVNAGHKDIAFNAKTTWKFSEKTSISLLGGYYDSEAGMFKTEYLFTAGMEERDKKMEKTDYYLGLFGETILMDRYELSLRLSYHRPKNKFWSENIGGMIPGFPPRPFYVPTVMTYGSEDYGIEVKIKTNLWKTSLTAGIEQVWNNGEWSVVNVDTGRDLIPKMDKGINISSLYLQGEIKPFEPLTAILGGRLDSHSQFGEFFSPKIGVLYKANDDTIIRSSVGRAFRAPSLHELYMPDWMRMPGMTFRSNPNLKPEEVIAYELGAEHLFFQRLLGKLTFFRNDTENLIRIVSMGGGIEQYQNIEETRSQGVEVELEAPIIEWLTASLNYTYTDARDKKTDEVLDYSPRNKVNLGLAFGKKYGNIDYKGSLWVRYVDSRYYTDMRSGKRYELSDYIVSDLIFSLTYKKRLEVFGAINNVTDKKYELYGSMLAPGRTYWAGLKVNF